MTVLFLAALTAVLGKEENYIIYFKYHKFKMPEGDGMRYWNGFFGRGGGKELINRRAFRAGLTRLYQWDSKKVEKKRDRRELKMDRDMFEDAAREFTDIVATEKAQNKNYFSKKDI